MDRTLLYLIVFAVTALPLLLAGFRGRPFDAAKPSGSRSLVSRLAGGPLGHLLLRLRHSAVEDVRAQLAKAGRRETSVEEIFVSQLLGGVGGALGCAAVGACLPEDAKPVAPLFVLMGLFIGWVLPTTSLGNAVQARQKALVKALPFAIDLLVSAMRSGLDFGAAIRYYVNLGDNGPLTEEFAAMLRENELGTGRITALRNMADRVRIPAFTAFVSAVALGTEMGSPLSETMEIQGEELRRARYALAENLAQKAPSKMILPMALFVMPAVFVIIFVPIYLRMHSI